ncbi:MAG: elongation factor G, partial [Candidatus Aminicenantes bacterium]|nr:elongation factor G [Candidatus Aminicenantes bacterium]
GIIDLVGMKAITYKGFDLDISEIPAHLKSQADEFHRQLIEKLADFDDNLMEKYLNDEEISEEDIKTAARNATLKLLITPVFIGAAFKNKGIQLLMDAVIDFLPSPVDRGIIVGYDTRNADLTISRKPSAKRPFSSLAFKIINDSYVGQQTFIRVYSGELSAGSYIYNSTKRKKERVGRILRVHANERKELTVIKVGDIGALIGLKFTSTGDTLCNEENPVLLENIKYPETVLDMKVEPVSAKDRDKLGLALNKMALEDPSFKVRYDSETSETIISGMGELHLEVIVDRLKTEHYLNIGVGKPAVGFRETITREARHEYKYKKQTGGRGQYAHIDFRIEPNTGKGITFVNNIKGGNIPGEYIPAVEYGFRLTMEKGLLAGFSMVDVMFVLIDGSFHPVDSSEMAFRFCTELAIKEAIKKTSPQLLEPVMKIEINTPDEFMGDIIADINRRRGRISNMRRYRKGSQKLSGRVPLMEMFGYASVLRTLSSGRSNFSLEFLNYQALPKTVEEKVIEEQREKKRHSGV